MDEHQAARAYALIFFGRVLIKCGVGATVLALVCGLLGWQDLALVIAGEVIGLAFAALLARVEAGTYGYGRAAA
jgi:hypothetical protein